MGGGMKAVVEVAVPEGVSTTECGRILERFAGRFLGTQNFLVEQEVRLTGSEVDLIASEKMTGEKVFVECKAQRSTIEADVIMKLLGKIDFEGCSSGWLISTYDLGKDAKGVMDRWSSRPPEQRRRLQVYPPDRLVERLVTSRVIVDPSKLGTGCGAAFNDECYLLLTQRGEFWARPIHDVTTGIRTSVMVFDAPTGSLITEPKSLAYLQSTNTTLRDLDWVCGAAAPETGTVEKLNEEIQSIVRVPSADKWADYRPARPEDFVGRENTLNEIFKFFDGIRNQTTKTRLFAIKAPSGFGKSSAVIKVADKARTKLHKNRLFVFSVDSRAATSKRFAELVVYKAFDEAIKAGFIEAPGGFMIGGIDSIFSSDTMATIARHMRDAGKIICIIFDQFEELLYKQELSSVFDDVKLLCNGVDSDQENLVIGFSWKTDGMITTDHKAYHLWHSLSDHRVEFDLRPFDHAEVAAALTKFSKELGEPLVPSLKRLLKDHCQGYPWLLKKLSIHVYELVRGGIDQADVVGQSLNIKDLFDKELQGLNEVESACIKFVAENSPVEFYKVAEHFSSDVANELIHKRIVIRSGLRLSLYWDIFRDYVLTGKVPEIPVAYIPVANFNKYIEGLKFILAKQIVSFRELEAVLKLGSGAVDNIVRDYVAVGHAEADRKNGRVRSLCGSEDDAIKVLLRFCRSHILYGAVEDYSMGSFIAEDEVIELSKQLYRHQKFSENTIRLYAQRLLRWFIGTGLLAHRGLAFEVARDGGITQLPSVVSGSRSYSHFMGDAPPESTIPALAAIASGPIDKVVFERQFGRNPGAVLRALGLAYQDERFIELIKPLNDTPENVLKEAVSRAHTVRFARRVLKDSPGITGEALGHALASYLGLEWSVGSMRRSGGALKRWATWLEDAPASKQPILV